MKDTNRAIQLFHRCVQALIDDDNFKPFYLHDINMYVTNSLWCENLKASGYQTEYEELNAIVVKHAQGCGYPLLADIDRSTLQDKRSEWQRNLLTHLKTYGIPNEHSN